MAGVLQDNLCAPPQDGRCIINNLPSELLSHIFTLGWFPERDHQVEEDGFEDVVEDDSRSSSDASSVSGSRRHMRRKLVTDEEKSRKLSFNVLVSHVCLRWRDIALSNSLLWNFIKFDGSPPYDRAEEYLRRAATAPLVLHIDRTNDDDDDDDDTDNDPDLHIITGIMDLVAPRMAQCRALEVMVSFYPQMHHVLERLGRCPGAPNLQVLQLYHYEDSDKQDFFEYPELQVQPFRLFNGYAPNLNAVALWGVHLDWSQEGSPFLAGLTDLELAYLALDVRPSFYDFARILRSSPNLQTLALCSACPAGNLDEWPPGLPPRKDDGKTDSSPVVFPKLEELTLAYLEMPHVMSLLPRFHLPALKSLALDLEDDDSSELLAYLASPASLPQPPPSSSSLLLLRGPGVAGAPHTDTTAPDRPRSLLANLAAFKVANLNCVTPAVLDTYRALTSLTALNINMTFVSSYAWFSLLDPSSCPSPAPAPSNPERERELLLLLPRLESLTVSGVSGDDIRGVVEARARAGARLKAVLVNEDDYVSEEDERWLVAHLDRFEYFEGSDEETDDDDDDGVDDLLEWGGSDDEGWEDEDDEDEDEEEDEDEDYDDDDDEFGDVLYLPL